MATVFRSPATRNDPPARTARFTRMKPVASRASFSRLGSDDLAELEQENGGPALANVGATKNLVRVRDKGVASGVDCDLTLPLGAQRPADGDELRPRVVPGEPLVVGGGGLRTDERVACTRAPADALLPPRGQVGQGLCVPPQRDAPALADRPAKSGDISSWRAALVPPLARPRELVLRADPRSD